MNYLKRYFNWLSENNPSWFEQLVLAFLLALIVIVITK